MLPRIVIILITMLGVACDRGVDTKGRGDAVTTTVLIPNVGVHDEAPTHLYRLNNVKDRDQGNGVPVRKRALLIDFLYPDLTDIPLGLTNRGDEVLHVSIRHYAGSESVRNDPGRHTMLSLATGNVSSIVESESDTFGVGANTDDALKIFANINEDYNRTYLLTRDDGRVASMLCVSADYYCDIYTTWHGVLHVRISVKPKYASKMDYIEDQVIRKIDDMNPTKVNTEE